MNRLHQDVLKLLTEDCRYPAEKIAVMLGVPADDVRTAIRELEEEHIIVKYSAVVNSEKANPSRVQALIEVRVTPQKNRGFDAIAEEIYGFSEVESVFLMSGGFDLSVLVSGKTLREVAMFVSERLSALPNVLSTATHFILKKYKVNGVIIEEINRPERLPVHP